MDTECDGDRPAGRGFNLSALYALLPLVFLQLGIIWTRLQEIVRSLLDTINKILYLKVRSAHFWILSTQLWILSPNVIFEIQNLLKSEFWIL